MPHKILSKKRKIILTSAQVKCITELPSDAKKDILYLKPSDKYIDFFFDNTKGCLLKSFIPDIFDKIAECRENDLTAEDITKILDKVNPDCKNINFVYSKDFEDIYSISL